MYVIMCIYVYELVAVLHKKQIKLIRLKVLKLFIMFS